MPQQFENMANPQPPYQTTGPEIRHDRGGCVDRPVAGVGTGGTISGAGQYLKQQKPSMRVIAVEPQDSPALSGGAPGPHKIQGIAAGISAGAAVAAAVKLGRRAENKGKTMAVIIPDWAERYLSTALFAGLES